MNIMDADFNGPSSEMYRAEVFPELFPHQKPMLIDNWPWDDLVMYCGGPYLEMEYGFETFKGVA